MLQAWPWHFGKACLFAVLLGIAGCAVRTSADHPAPDYVLAEVQLGSASPAMTESRIDSLDRYASTVKVSTALQVPGQGTSIRECSGVLIHPRLVLTAAHCVCHERRPRPPEADDTSIVDGSTCAQRADVTLIRYGSGETPAQVKLRTRSSKLRFREFGPFSGAVQVHEDLRIVYRTLKTSEGLETNTEHSHADLAVIILSIPLERTVKPAKLAEEPVQLEEKVVMVGFGAENLGQMGGDGERRYGENAVVSIKEDGSTFHVGRQLQIAPSYSGEKPRVVRRAGSYAAAGDSGGPCFRERKGALELVGIARSTHGPPIVLSVYTSTHAYMDWLREQITDAENHRTD